VKKYIVVDMNDAHEAHAFFALLFDCENCGRVMDFQSSHTELSDEWYLELAKQAKVEGWYVPPADADGKVDVMSAWCCQCAGMMGLHQAASRTTR
jgi:hypothetical protein